MGWKGKTGLVLASVLTGANLGINKEGDTYCLGVRFDSVVHNIGFAAGLMEARRPPNFLCLPHSRNGHDVGADFNDAMSGKNVIVMFDGKKVGSFALVPPAPKTPCQG